LQKSYQTFETTLKPKQQKRHKKFFFSEVLVDNLFAKKKHTNSMCFFVFWLLKPQNILKKKTARENKQTTSFESKPNIILKVLSFLVSYQVWLF